MKLYHGSENIIERPEFGKGKVHNDYGRGFYCTENHDLACEWAVDDRRDGYVNAYDFPIEEFSVLDLNSLPNPILAWISILLENRVFKVSAPIEIQARKYLLEKYLPDYKKYDVIRGYRADDSYFSFAQDFISNTISLEQLEEAMHYGQLGEQIVIKSRAAFERIEFIGIECAACETWYPPKEVRDSQARQAYSNLSMRAYDKSETYVMMILNEGH